MRLKREIVGVIIFVLVFGSLTVLLVDSEYEKKDIVITVNKKWIKDGKFYFNDTTGRVYELSDSYRPPLYDSMSRYNIIQEGRSYKIDTMGGRLNFSIFRPNAYNIREVGLDSSKP